MGEKIIPEKKPLFQPKNQNPQQTQKPTKQIAPSQTKEEEQKPLFNIPLQAQIQLQAIQSIEQKMQQLVEPVKKKAWKRWIMVAAAVIIILGLGFYFLS